jgi:hypothetical protein
MTSRVVPGNGNAWLNGERDTLNEVSVAESDVTSSFDNVDNMFRDNAYQQ